MSVTVTWEFRFSSENAAEGLRLTQEIWKEDMQAFDGLIGHELIQDLDDSGHLLVISRWTNREAPDRSKDEYAQHPNRQAVDALVSEPRRRLVGRTVP